MNPSAPPSSGSGRPVFFRKKDVFLLLGILCLAAVLFLFLRPRIRPDAPVAVVSVGIGSEQETLRIPLDEDGLHEIEAELPVQLLIEEGSIRFVHSVCPDHLCEGFGRLRYEGDTAVCLPAGVSVRVEEYSA